MYHRMGKDLLSYLLFLCVWLFVVFEVHGRLRLSRLTRDRGVREGRVVRRSKKGLKRNITQSFFFFSYV